MARARAVDGNQKDIVKACRKVGYSVFVASGMGEGFPDLVVGAHGANYLFEIKDPSKPEKDRKLTPAQQDFFQEWRGQVQKVETFEEILQTIGDQYRRQV